MCVYRRKLSYPRQCKERAGANDRFKGSALEASLKGRIGKGDGIAVDPLSIQRVA